MSFDVSDYLSVNDFAKVASVHPNTVRRMIKKNRLSCIDVGSGSRKIYRIPATEFFRLGLDEFDKNIDEIVSKKVKEALNENNE